MNLNNRTRSSAPSIGVIGGNQFALLVAAVASASSGDVVTLSGRPDAQVHESFPHVRVRGFDLEGDGQVEFTGDTVPKRDLYLVVGSAKDWIPTVRRNASLFAGRALSVMGGGVAACAAAVRALDDEVGPAHGTIVTEIQSFPFIGTADTAGLCTITGVKRRLGVTALDPMHARFVKSVVSPWLPDLVVREYLELTFSDVNPIIHPTVCLANMRRIDRAERYIFYRDGLSQSIGLMMTAMDKERMAVLGRAGIPCQSVHETLLGFYRDQGMSASSLVDALGLFAPYDTSIAPDSFGERFITNDVSFGLSPLVDLADAVGVSVPLLAGTVAASEAVSGQSLRDRERWAALQDLLSQ